MNLRRNTLIKIFMQHPVAANLLMTLMLLAGIFAFINMNIQFFPTFDINVVKIRIVWPGASADDVEKSIIYPIEKELRAVNNIKTLKSFARLSAADITVEFNEGTNMTIASEQVRDALSRVRVFPDDSEKPIVDVVEPDERIANILIYGPKTIDELRHVTWASEQELLDKGISRVSVVGLPKQRISIELNPQNLNTLGLSFNDIASAVASESQDIPAGQIGKADNAQNLRSVEKKRTVKAFRQVRIQGRNAGESITLADIAKITKTYSDEDPVIFYEGKPAVLLKLFRKNQDNSLTSAKIAQSWLNEKQKQFGNTIHLVIFDENWVLIKERINTLVSNGLSGLILIILLLFLFLNRSSALWVSAGIPVSVMASLFILYMFGGSINMISLFAFILTLGIIVDDTIVVGEQALTNINQQEKVGPAILQACYKMLPPISSSSLTTISAFIPLLAISGPIGTVLYDIPLVVICVILASILECFLILPGHLYHANHRNPQKKNKKSKFRVEFDRYFYHFQNKRFKPFLNKALYHHVWVSCFVILMIFLTYSLISFGILRFTFFPTPDADLVKANVQFMSGTSTQDKVKFLQSIVKDAKKLAKDFDHQNQDQNQPSLKLAYYTLNQIDDNDFRQRLGSSYASVFIQLSSGENRSYATQTFLEKLKSRIKLNDTIDNLAISSPRGGPPGKDIEIQINHTNINTIKASLLEIDTYLSNTKGVSGVSDNLPYSQEQLIFHVNENGKQLGLTTNSIGAQLRAAFNGEILQTFNDPNEEVEVLVQLEQGLRYNRATFQYLPIKTPQNTLVPLRDVIEIDYKKMPDVIIHNENRLSGNIEAEVNAKQANANRIISDMKKTVLKQLVDKYGITYQFRGRAEDQSETLYEIKVGTFTALSLIYIILAWVFRSYLKPIIVMIAIPLGLIGALFGHAIMGIDVTLLSIFGLFGLSGIVINDSIILINEYQSLKANNISTIRVITEATSRRFRAILLTSTTTIAGLTPLLFETSLQAQFLIPMACSIVFGLAFATTLLLVVIPVFLMYIETIQKRLNLTSTEDNSKQSSTIG